MYVDDDDFRTARLRGISDRRDGVQRWRPPQAYWQNAELTAAWEGGWDAADQDIKRMKEVQDG